MNDDLNEFERVARARLQRELGRVPVPAGRATRARPRSSRSWGARMVGGSALVAMLALVALIVVGSVRVSPQSGQAATQTAQASAGPGAERLILLSSTASSTLVRAVDPATRQVLWTVENPAQAATSGAAWIDGAVAPDGSRVFVATEQRLAAYDAASGKLLWGWDSTGDDVTVKNAPGQPSALAVAPDGRSLYVHKTSSQERWLDVIDTASGVSQDSLDFFSPAVLPRVIPMDDRIYFVAADDVVTMGLNKLSRGVYSQLPFPSGVRAVAQTGRDDRVYVLDGNNHLWFMDSNGATKNGGYDLGIVDARSSLSGALAMSPDGNAAAVQVLDDPAGPLKLYLYAIPDPHAAWQRTGTITDPGADSAHWLRGDTIRFSQSGGAIYGVTAPDGTGALLSLNVADGSPTTLLDLPGETVAALLVAEPPVAAPDVAGPPSELPTADPAAPTPPLPFPIPDLESIPHIPLTHEPLVPAGEIGWLVQSGQLLAWDRDGSMRQPITDSSIAAFRWAVPRLGKKPLLLVGLDDGRDAVLDPETAAITPLDLPGRSIKPPFVLSPDGAQLAFKRSSPGLPDALAQADLATGATWTLLDGAALGEHAAWLDDGSLIGWARSGIYFEVTSPLTREMFITLGAEWPRSLRLLRIQPRASASAAAAEYTQVLWLLDGGTLSFSPAAEQLVYSAALDPQLRLLDTSSGEDQAVDASPAPPWNFSLSPDGAQLAYIKVLSAPRHYVVSVYSPQTGRVTSVVRLTEEQSRDTSLRWSPDGRYLIVLTVGESTVVQVFDTLTSAYTPDLPVPLMARYALPGAVAEAAVQQVTLGSDMLINVITVSSSQDGVELDVYNPLNSTRQTFDLGDEPAALVFVP
jgi:Tol biopolymer transport system component